MGPERSLRGAALNYYSIQVGIGSGLAHAFAGQWVTGITDITPQATKIADRVRNGQAAAAQRLLPPERPYPVPPAIAHRLCIDTGSLPAPGVHGGKRGEAAVWSC